MRLILVSPFFTPIVGGVESVLDTTTEALARAGHRVRVISSSFPGLPTEEEHGNVSIVRTQHLDVPPDGVLPPDEFDFRENEHFLSEIVSDFGPSVVHFHNFQMRQYSMFLTSFLSGPEGKKLPCLDTVHNDVDDSFAQYILSYLPLNAVITVTKRAAISLLEARIPEDRLHIVPNMIDAAKYRMANGRSVRRRIGVEEDTPLILFPSRLVGREGNFILDSNSGKGIGTLIRALPEIFENVPDAKVLMLGNDPVYHDRVSSTKKQLKVIADKIGVGDKLAFFNQFVPNTMLPEIFSAADVVVSLSARETFGMVFVEAMAAGRPVIGVSSNVGGVSEVVPDGKAGLLVPEADSHATAKAVSTILTDEEMKAGMGLYGMKWVKSRYDVPVVMPQLLSLYERLVGETRGKKEVLQSYKRRSLESPDVNLE